MTWYKERGACEFCGAPNCRPFLFFPPGKGPKFEKTADGKISSSGINDPLAFACFDCWLDRGPSSDIHEQRRFKERILDLIERLPGGFLEHRK